MQTASPPDDGPDVPLAVRGDREAFARLVAGYYDVFYRIGWRHAGTRQDAEDIAQDACMRMGASIRSYRGDGPGGFKAWACRVATNAAIDHCRRSGQRERLSRGYADELPLSSDDDSLPDLLWAAVRRLPEKARTAVTLVYSEGLSHAEAAEAMGCAAATVSWHVHDARMRLKSMLEAEGQVHAR